MFGGLSAILLFSASEQSLCVQQKEAASFFHSLDRLSASFTCHGHLDVHLPPSFWLLPGRRLLFFALHSLTACAPIHLIVMSHTQSGRMANRQRDRHRQCISCCCGSGRAFLPLTALFHSRIISLSLPSSEYETKMLVMPSVTLVKRWWCISIAYYPVFLHLPSSSSCWAQVALNGSATTTSQLPGHCWAVTVGQFPPPLLFYLFSSRHYQQTSPSVLLSECASSHSTTAVLDLQLGDGEYDMTTGGEEERGVCRCVWISAHSVSLLVPTTAPSFAIMVLILGEHFCSATAGISLCGNWDELPNAHCTGQFIERQLNCFLTALSLAAADVPAFVGYL